MSKHVYFLAAGLAKMIVGIITVLITLQYFESKYFLRLGAKAWVLAILLKWLWAVPFHDRTIEWIIKNFSASKVKIIGFIYSGMLTGITECGMTLYFVYKYPRLFESNYNSAVAFGIGFGAFEAVICGLGTLALGVATFLKKYKKPSIDEASPQNYELIHIIFPLSERIFALLLHTFSCVLTVMAVQKDNFHYFTFAFLLKFICDGYAQLVFLEKKQSSDGNVSQKTFLMLQACLVFLALISLLGLIVLS